MPKKIVLLLDGTSNEIKADRTNILRLYGTLVKSDTQLVYYDPGVGTFGAEQAWSQFIRKGREIWGMITGWGLDANVKEAYRFIVDNYETYDDGTHDQIFIFGFSRGAYSARVLAGFLHAFGLLERRNLNLLDYVYRAYKRVDPDGDADSFAELGLHCRIIQPDQPPIRCLGLFDTVSSVIESGRAGIPRLRKHAFTEDNPSVEAVRHAVAIVERRTMFVPQLWPAGQTFRQQRPAEEPAPPQDAKEVWFNGYHADVGGGSEEMKSGLAKIPLDWMIRETRALGLDFDQALVRNLVFGEGTESARSKPDPLAAPNPSMNWAWHLLEYLPRRKPRLSRRRDLRGWILPRCEPRTIPDGAHVHVSVLKAAERPDNLPDAFELVDDGGNEP
ncbi:DUF2235 domain-containing protein [Hasllibacter sp. MH4015]|uniref:DUF2235 domain-containing protein n=1 Tax=Hasllibacter sp. MH4015 TaxID=2854029 RepID=UPI001CD51D00